MKGYKGFDKGLGGGNYFVRSSDKFSKMLHKRI